MFTDLGHNICHKKLVKVGALLRPVRSDCEEGLDSSCVYI